MVVKPFLKRVLCQTYNVCTRVVPASVVVVAAGGGSGYTVKSLTQVQKTLLQRRTAKKQLIIEIRHNKTGELREMGGGEAK